MSGRIQITLRSTILGVILVGTPLGAEALTVGRCNALVGGKYTPVLVVEADGKKTVHNIGEAGLTRRVVFNAKAAVAWAIATYGLAPSAVSYSDKCSSAGSDAITVISPGGGGGGGECGGGECGGGECGGGDCGGSDSSGGGDRG